MMNTYEREQAFTDRYGEALMRQIAYSFGCTKYQRVTDKETQVQGVDYFMWKDGCIRTIKQKVDLKIDYYENMNAVIELDQQYTGVGEKSWIEHDGDIWVAYFKVAQRCVYIYKTSDLQKFMETETFKKRKTFETNRKVNGKAGHFKNFLLDELPIHHVVNIEMFYNPFEYDKELLNTKVSLLDGVLYANE